MEGKEPEWVRCKYVGKVGRVRDMPDSLSVSVTWETRSSVR